VILFIDANVIFTAAYSPKGKAYFLITNRELFKAKFITSDYALEEARRNLANKKMDALLHLDLLMKHIDLVTSVIGNCPIQLPKKDEPIFLAALKNQATHLITGDIKDFGPFMNDPNKAFGIIIQTVSEYLYKI
jgi:predicted nucleic acid-binding protein